MGRSGSDTSGRLFLSYRRADAGGWAGRLYDRLTDVLGDDQVFMDVESIHAGDRWRDRLESEIESSSGMVVVIGPDWSGRDRIRQEDDPVRFEVASALASDRQVLPVLVGGASMPAESDVPDDLGALLDHHAVVLEPSLFDAGVDRLLAELGIEERSRRPWWIVGAVVVVIAAVASFLLLRGGSDPVQAMTGDFNVAVAAFDVLRDGEQAESAAGEDLAGDVAERLTSDLADLEREGFQLEIRDPADIAPIEGDDQTTRAEAAARLADEIDADVVIYGSLSVDDGGSELSPEFYLNQRRLAEAPELAGQYGLAGGIQAVADVTVNPAAANQLRQEVTSAASAFSEVVFGLSYYAIREWTTAEQHFRSADEAWTTDGREVVLLFLGDSLGRQGSFELALDEFAAGASLAPDYSRIPLSEGEALFQLANGGCTPDTVDQPGLGDAEAAYQRAFDAAEQPPLADVPLRSQFGLARLDLCRMQAGAGGDVGSIESRLTEVTDAYEAGNTRIAEVAAEAYGALALLGLQAPEGPATADFETAAELYLLAAEAATDPERASFFYRVRGSVLLCAGDEAEAAAAFESARAVATDPDAVDQEIERIRSEVQCA